MVSHLNKNAPAYISLLIQTLLLAYFGGQLTERVNNNTLAIKEMKQLVYEVIKDERKAN